MYVYVCKSIFCDAHYLPIVFTAYLKSVVCYHSIFLVAQWTDPTKDNLNYFHCSDELAQMHDVGWHLALGLAFWFDFI